VAIFCRHQSARIGLIAFIGRKDHSAHAADSNPCPAL
jgi:hypothetical protein